MIILRRFFYVTGVLSLVCFSFYYTDLATSIIKANDPIMKEIKKTSCYYEEESVDAILVNNNITPGISGIKVDIDKTYASMKRYGSFNESLIIYEEVIPSISVTNIFDKYIVGGNKTKKMISLAFVIDNYSFITEIINILDSKNIKATFFISNNIITESKDILKFIDNSKHEIELYSDTYDTILIDKNNTLLKKYINKNINFCYSETENDIILNNCSSKKIHTIIPNINTSNYPYSDIKKHIEAGSIIKLNNNEIVVRELKYILNYINQKGYSIVTLKELLSE